MTKARSRGPVGMMLGVLFVGPVALAACGSGASSAPAASPARAAPTPTFPLPLTALPGTPAPSESTVVGKQAGEVAPDAGAGSNPSLKMVALEIPTIF